MTGSSTRLAPGPACEAPWALQHLELGAVQGDPEQLAVTEVDDHCLSAVEGHHATEAVALMGDLRADRDRLDLRRRCRARSVERTGGEIPALAGGFVGHHHQCAPSAIDSEQPDVLV